MIELLWVPVVAVVLTVWTYRHWPLRVKDLGSISARWLQEHREHQDR